MANNNTTEPSTFPKPDDPCIYTATDHLESRYYVTLFGTSLSIIGIGANILILLVFGKFMTAYTPNTLLLSALACFDILVLISYMLLYSVQIISEYHQDLDLRKMWMNYTPTVFPLSRFSQIVTVYIMLTAYIERCLVLTKPVLARRIFTPKFVKIVIVLVIFLSFCSQVSRFWEAEGRTFNCTNINAYQVLASELLQHDTYRTVYSLWIANLFQIVIPFLTLLILTVVIIRNFRSTLVRGSFRLHAAALMPQPASLKRKLSTSWRKRNKQFQTELLTDQERDMKRRLKDITTVLIVLVVAYLTFNALSFSITLIEFFDINFLHENADFYDISVPVINICAVLNASIRLLNYLIFNEDFRRTTTQHLGFSRKLVNGTTDFRPNESSSKNGHVVVEDIIILLKTDDTVHTKTKTDAEDRDNFVWERLI